MESISEAIRTSLIDKDYASQKDLRIRLLYNDYKRNMKLSYELESLLVNCESFAFSVAFISESGLATLKEKLFLLQNRGIKGKIITSTYLGFNSPRVFKELLKFQNIEVRIFNDKIGFHPKGYIFKNKDHYKIIVGSSNLTQNALSINQEWNICLTSNQNGEIVEQIINEFEYQWRNSLKLNDSWIEEYEKNYIEPIKIKQPIRKNDITPNYMQREALESLNKLRADRKEKALLISATGTGKTYLAAFDVKAYHPKKMLFVVHRKSIALKAMETFQTLIGDRSMGLFSGNHRDLNKDYIFSTVQTIHKPEYRELFNKDEFEYIIIDEVHKAGAQSYQDLMSYFTPRFVLGMSATPERSDDFDIYKMFDYNIAFEIRLQEAMEYNLLCPFHYYGITDFIVDNEFINDKTEFNLLVSDLRVDYIIQKINDYGYSGNKVHGLIFCSRKQEAIELSNIFNKRGYKTIALTGDDNEVKRQNAMDRLESDNEDGLDYIFTVDIFNEGIDIPKVNQVIMLRPTESAIIFVQQLGRGLRKYEDKEYVVVIDFIGNYEKNFLIPIALSGSLNYNKDNLRRFIEEGSLIIPGASTIQFDEISKKKIYESIDSANFNHIKIIKESYFELKGKLGRIPHLSDFSKYNAIDVQRIFQNKNLGSYHEFLKKYEKDYKIKFNALEEKYLEFISVKLSSGKRVQELEAIKIIIENHTHLLEYLKEKMKIEYDLDMPNISIKTITNILQQNFATGSAKETYKDVAIIDKDFNISQTFLKLLQNVNFKSQVMEVIDYAIDVYKTNYSQKYANTDFCLYKKYTYEDVCRLLNWDKSLVALNIGGYYYDKRTNTLPVFINYDKEEHIAETIKYEDHFIDPKTFVAMSKNNRRIDDKSMDMFVKAKERNTQIHLFVRKNKDDKGSKEFYYMGLIRIIEIQQEYLAKKPICKITYQLDKPVKRDIYDFIVN